MKIILAALAVLFMSAPDLNASTKYFPMTVNNSWSYQSKFLISTTYFTETIVDKKNIGNQDFFVFNDFRLGSSVYLGSVENSIVTLIDGMEYRLYDFDANVGDRWDAPDPPNLIIGKMTLKSKTDTVQTPLATFYNCYHFHHYIDSGNYYDEWFAPGVGIVMRNTMLMSGKFEAKIIDYFVSHVQVAKNDIPTDEFRLFPNYPNPFNSSTTIKYKIAKPAHVRLDVFNVRGKLVRTLVDANMPAGGYSTDFDGVDDRGAPLPSGLYFYQLVAGENIQLEKASLVK